MGNNGRRCASFVYYLLNMYGVFLTMALARAEAERMERNMM